MNGKMPGLGMMAAILLVVATATAQNVSHMPRIGWISAAASDDAERSLFFDAFREGLRDLGYVEGENLAIESIWARGSPERVVDLARSFIATEVDVIVSQGAAIRGVRQVADSIPVVFALSADPVLAGLVDSLARPGGIFTGITFMSYQVNSKRLDLLKEALPAVSRIVLLSNPEHPGEALELEESRRAADILGLEILYLPVRTEAELENALTRIAAEEVQALVALPDALVMQHRHRIIDFATERRIPTISGWSAFARSGAVFTYGPKLEDSFRRLALYVDKILKGAEPADIPVEQPAEFELVVNLKAAKALGIELPAAILLRADEVID